MIDDIFTAALALALLFGGTVAIGSTWTESAAQGACDTRAGTLATR